MGTNKSKGKPTKQGVLRQVWAQMTCSSTCEVARAAGQLFKRLQMKRIKWSFAYDKEKRDFNKFLSVSHLNLVQLW